jgi:HlyD family secretion protein
MIRDTSAQDRLVEVKPNHKRRLLWIGVAVAVVVIGALVLPQAGRIFSADASVSASRLAFGTVERGPFVRDIAAEGKVVAAVSPTLYATYGGAVTMKVHAGDQVKKGQILATVDSPELLNKLAQEQSNADAMQVEFLRAQIDAKKKRGELQKAYDNAQIDQETATRDLARYEKAYTQGAVPNMDVDKAKDTLKKSQISSMHAKADLGMDNDSLNFDIQSKKLAHDRQLILVKDLQRQVEELNVRSPVDGQVGQLFVAERATVAKDAQLLSVIDLSALEVEMKVPESFARDLGIGMGGEITGNGNTWKGLVSAISP